MQSLNSDCLPALGLRPPFCILKPKPLDYWDVCWVQLLSCIWFFRIPRSVAHQTPLSMGFVWQEYWSGLPFPPPGDLPHPGVDPESLVSPALAGGFFTTGTTWEAPCNSGHPVNVDWRNERSPPSHRWRASRLLSARKETDQLFNFSGFPRLHLLLVIINQSCVWASVDKVKLPRRIGVLWTGPSTGSRIIKGRQKGKGHPRLGR